MYWWIYAYIVYVMRNADAQVSSAFGRFRGDFISHRVDVNVLGARLAHDGLASVAFGESFESV